MGESTEDREGGCLCSAARHRTSGAPEWVARCHRTSRRRATGAPFATCAGFAADAFAVTRGEPRAQASSRGVIRRLCGRCGTPLTHEGDRWPDAVHILAAILDDLDSVTPTGHVHTSGQLGRVHLDDGLPAFGATAGRA